LTFHKIIFIFFTKTTLVLPTYDILLTYPLNADNCKVNTIQFNNSVQCLAGHNLTRSVHVLSSRQSTQSVGHNPQVQDIT